MQVHQSSYLVVLGGCDSTPLLRLCNARYLVEAPPYKLLIVHAKMQDFLETRRFLYSTLEKLPGSLGFAASSVEHVSVKD